MGSKSGNGQSEREPLKQERIIRNNEKLRRHLTQAVTVDGDKCYFNAKSLLYALNYGPIPQSKREPIK